MGERPSRWVSSPSSQAAVNAAAMVVMSGRSCMRAPQRPPLGISKADRHAWTEAFGAGGQSPLLPDLAQADQQPSLALRLLGSSVIFIDKLHEIFGDILHSRRVTSPERTWP